MNIIKNDHRRTFPIKHIFKMMGKFSLTLSIYKYITTTISLDNRKCIQFPTSTLPLYVTYPPPIPLSLSLVYFNTLTLSIYPITLKFCPFTYVYILNKINDKKKEERL